MKDKVHFKRLFSFVPEQRNRGSSAGIKDDELQYEIIDQGGTAEGLRSNGSQKGVVRMSQDQFKRGSICSTMRENSESLKKVVGNHSSIHSSKM